MYVTSLYVQANHQLSKLFDKIRSAKTPEKFSVKILKEWGFSSSAHLAFIPLLKELGFLANDGMPTTRYLEFQEAPDSSSVLSEAIRDAYRGIFIMADDPQDLDHSTVQAGFQQAHNGTVREANLMTETFFELLKISNICSFEGPDTHSSDTPSGPWPGVGAPFIPADGANSEKASGVRESRNLASRRSGGGSKAPKEADRLEDRKEVVKEQIKAFSSALPVPIQINLPDTKDIEVFDAIFKSLKKHLIK